MKIENYTDREIVQAILNRDTLVTKEFLYRKCYPLFKTVFDKYYTDCESPAELISEIYVYIMYPQKKSQVSKLAGFGFRCTLTLWLKIVSENYCHQLFAKRMPADENISMSDDRYILDDYSFEVNSQKLDRDDFQRILTMMPNQRYRLLIEARYMDERTHEETAQWLGMTMANYYNCHKRAKAQYCEALRKEGLI